MLKYRRRIAYYLWLTSVHRFHLVRSVADLWGIKLSVMVRHDGIGIGDRSLHSGARINDMKLFVKIVRDALTLIQATDRRRYATVIREIKYIMNNMCRYGSIASYNILTRSCYIDFNQYDHALIADDYEQVVRQIAFSIVHEATHGYLFSRFVPYTEDNRVRVEKICIREEKRFAAKLDNLGRDSAAG